MIDLQAVAGVQGPPGPSGGFLNIVGKVSRVTDLPVPPMSYYDAYVVTADNKLYVFDANTNTWVATVYTVPNTVVPLNKGGTGVDNTAITANRVFAGPSSGSSTGSASWRTLVAADLPIVPADKGGTGIATSTTPNKIFATATSGSSAAVPSFRSLVAADIPNLDAGKITTGILPISRGGIGIATSSTPNLIFGTAASGSSSQAPSFRKLVAADIPNFDASKITSGTLPVARGGTGISTSSTPNRVFATAASGTSSVAPSFRALVAADIPNISASKITSGIMAVERGGTGVSTVEVKTNDNAIIKASGSSLTFNYINRWYWGKIAFLEFQVSGSFTTSYQNVGTIQGKYSNCKALVYPSSSSLAGYTSGNFLYLKASTAGTYTAYIYLYFLLA